MVMKSWKGRGKSLVEKIEALLLVCARKSAVSAFPKLGCANFALGLLALSQSVHT